MSESTAELQRDSEMEAAFQRYHVGWETRNPDLIASLHTEDTLFAMHDGTAPVRGREALRKGCEAMFAQFDFSFEMGCRLYGKDHWIFEWLMVLNLIDTAGQPFVAKIEMLDVVTLAASGLVESKHVYMNGAQAQAAFGRAGIERTATHGS